MLCLKTQEYFRTVLPIEMEMCFSGCLSRQSASQSEAEVG